MNPGTAMLSKGSTQYLILTVRYELFATLLMTNMDSELLWTGNSILVISVGNRRNIRRHTSLQLTIMIKNKVMRMLLML
nr:unnamed protein product [Callosobruchus analis]